MARRYCSRCLQAFGSFEDPRICARPTCTRTRPEDGWPAFLSFADRIDDRYRVEEILGAGGAGITYRCIDEVRGETVAVKVLHADRRNGVLANRLAIEGEVLELLSHPHVVPFRALNLVGNGHAYLVTRHMPGGSLDGFVRSHGRVSPKGGMRLGRQMALALDYVHAGGIVHRDLKPANVLLQSDDPEVLHARIADFGIARIFNSPRPMPDLTRTGAFIGTPEYAAPEQVRGERGVGPAADCFALGALLHFVVSGEPLHRREDLVDWDEFRNRDWDPAKRPRLAWLVSEDPETVALLDEVIDALMHPDAAARIDMATAAMRLGANPAELAPRNLPAFSPPTLVSHQDLPGDDDALDALVPRESPAESGPTLILGTGPVPAAERSPLAEAMPVPLTPLAITRDTSTDLVGEEVEWPTAQTRRNRRHAFGVVAAALLAGTALAWPGGPGALMESTNLASLAAPLQELAEELRVAEPVTRAEPAPRAGVVVPERAQAPKRQPLRAGMSAPAPKRSVNRTERAKTQAAPTQRAEPVPQPIAKPTLIASPEPRAPVEPSPEPLAPIRVEPEALAMRPPAARVPQVADPEVFEALSADAELDARLRSELDVERGRYVDMLRRQQMEADVRAMRYEKQAEQQRAELDQAMQRWTTIRERATGEPAEELEEVVLSEGDATPALDSIFDQAVRVRPRGEACD